MDERCKNCALLVPINCHPSNGNNKQFGWLEDPHKIGKGRINTQLAYGCLLSLEDRLKDEYSGGFVTYFDSAENVCEMFASKDEFELSITVKEKKK